MVSESVRVTKLSVIGRAVGASENVVTATNMDGWIEREIDRLQQRTVLS